MILSCNHLMKSFVTDVLFNDISFIINEKEKVAIVGINGAGKSTLFKIIMKELSADSGEIIIPNTVSLGYLSQNSSLDSDKTIYEEILSAKAEIIEMETTLQEMEQEMAKLANDEAAFNQLSEKYMKLRHAFEALDGYSYKSQVKGVLKGLGFSEDEFGQLASVLSGGQKTRLALAKILITHPDILLLDEPTNHLDIAATEWLESYLTSYSGTLLIISHDRYFLDKITTKVIELENGKCTTYIGNYTSYFTLKEKNREIEEKHYENQQKEIRRQEEVIQQLRAFNREKSIKRAQSREKALEKIERLDKPITLNDSMRFKLKPKVESGNDVLTIKNLGKVFTEQALFESVDFNIFKGEKVALIGSNGSGKTTIFKIINNQIPATTGQIKLGTNVYLGYYDQEHSLLNIDNNLIEEISDTYPNMTNGEIRNVLAAFLFTKDDVFKKIASLSGGEKGRITLAKLMLSQANFILLDEPTNHLDIVSKEILERNLKDYSGTILFISHDRYFINQVATRILELTPTGIINYPGNYDYYIEKRDALKNVSNISLQQNKNNIKPNKELWLQKKEEETQRRRKEKLIEKIEAQIHNIEEKISEIDLLLCEEDIYTNHEKVQSLTKDKASFEEDLIDLYEKWESLHE